MQRYWVAGVALLLAVAVAVPAWGDAGGRLLQALEIAKEARDLALEAHRDAHEALRVADKGLNRADRGLERIKKTKGIAKAAHASAAQAEGFAQQAQGALAAMKAVSDSAPGTVSTLSDTFVSFPDGPSVTVMVPQSG
jgi:hypothetical protein